VLDTYVAVSAPVFREGRLAWLREAWAAGRVVPLVSAETLAELVRVLANPKLKLSDEETKNVLAHYMGTRNPGQTTFSHFTNRKWWSVPDLLAQ